MTPEQGTGNALAGGCWRCTEALWFRSSPPARYVGYKIKAFFVCVTQSERKLRLYDFGGRKQLLDEAPSECYSKAMLLYVYVVYCAGKAKNNKQRSLPGHLEPCAMFVSWLS